MTGSRIRALRESVGMSARELSRIARLPSETHVSLIEKKPHAPITTATAIAIADVFGCSLDWLLRGMGSAPSPRAVRRAAERARARVQKRAA